MSKKKAAQQVDELNELMIEHAMNVTHHFGGRWAPKEIRRTPVVETGDTPLSAARKLARRLKKEKGT